MRQDARRQLREQMLHPTDTPGHLPSMVDIRRAFDLWLDRRGLQRETFKPIDYKNRKRTR